MSEQAKEKTIYVVSMKGGYDHLVKASSKPNALAYFATVKKADANDVAELKGDGAIAEAE